MTCSAGCSNSRCSWSENATSFTMWRSRSCSASVPLAALLSLLTSALPDLPCRQITRDPSPTTPRTLLLTPTVSCRKTSRLRPWPNPFRRLRVSPSSSPPPAQRRIRLQCSWSRGNRQGSIVRRTRCSIVSHLSECLDREIRWASNHSGRRAAFHPQPRQVFNNTNRHRNRAGLTQTSSQRVPLSTIIPIQCYSVSPREVSGEALIRLVQYLNSTIGLFPCRILYNNSNRAKCLSWGRAGAVIPRNTISRDKTSQRVWQPRAGEVTPHRILPTRCRQPSS